MNNPFKLAKFINNPHAFIQQMMNNSEIMQNPIAKNTFELFQKGDNKKLEEIARNLCSENGIDADDALKQIKAQFGM